MKWVRRNPVVATLLAAVVLTVVGGVAGIYWKYLDVVEQKGIAEGAVAAKGEALEREREAKERAEKGQREARGQLANSSILLAQAAYDSNDVPVPWLWLTGCPQNPTRSAIGSGTTCKRLFNGAIFTLRGHTKIVSSRSFQPRAERPSPPPATTVRCGGGMPAPGGPCSNSKATPSKCTAWPSCAADGRLLATAGGDKTRRGFGTRTAEQLLLLKGHSNVVSGVAFSPDGATIATASMDATRADLGRPHRQRLRRQLKGHAGPLSSCSVQPRRHGRRHCQLRRAQRGYGRPRTASRCPSFEGKCPRYSASPSAPTVRR